MNDIPAPANKKGSRTSWLLGGAALLVVGLGAVIARQSSTAEGSISGQPIFEVVEGPLLISVVESGTISAREQEVIKSEVEGQTQILWLIPEGERVQEGDLLVRLDSSRLEDQKLDEQIRVQNAEADYINARENLEVVKSQAESDVNAAKLAFQFAGEDLTKYREGDFPNQLKEAQARVTLAEADMASAEEDLGGKRRLHEKNFITAIELDTSERFRQRAVLDLELAQADMELLKGFTYNRNLAQLESDEEEAEMALERATLKASANIVQAEADFKAKESEFQREQSKLDKLIRQIEKTEIRASTSGLVVHATSSQGGGRMGGKEPLEEGQMVRERQEIIHLPTASSVMAKVSIHESNLAKVRLGLGVRITVDALPGQSFTGHVARIAQLPNAQSIWMNPDLKVYDAEIFIDGDGSELRSGMSCQAEIMVERHAMATYVPVQAVVLNKGKPTVFVVNGREVEQRIVEVGLDNNRMVRIAANLKAGERVLLAPPEPEEPAEETANEEENFVEAAPPPKLPEAGQQTQPAQGGGERGWNLTQEQRDAMRKRYENISPEQMKEMRKRFESMSPEERERIRQRMQGGGGRPGQ